MASVNFCAFIGTAGSDPKVRSFENGGKIASVNIAVSEKFRTKSGENKENTEWVPLVFNDKLAEVAEKFIRKGSLVYVSGKLHTRSWLNNNGEQRTQTEISVRELQLLSRKESDSDLPE